MLFRFIRVRVSHGSQTNCQAENRETGGSKTCSGIEDPVGLQDVFLCRRGCRVSDRRFCYWLAEIDIDAAELKAKRACNRSLCLAGIGACVPVPVTDKDPPRGLWVHLQEKRGADHEKA